MSSSKRESMFAKLAAQQAKPLQEEAAPADEPAADDTPPSPALPEPAPQKSAPSRSKRETVKGKRVHPDYCQANAYIPKRLRRAVDKALFDMEGMDYSTLVEDLLRKWLKSRGVSE
jgi:hypothetical protein